MSQHTDNIQLQKHRHTVRNQSKNPALIGLQSVQSVRLSRTDARWQTELCLSWLLKTDN